MGITKTPPPPKDDDDNVEQVVSLLPFEVSMTIMQDQFSTASLTWYKMDSDDTTTFEQVAAATRERLNQILDKNPWLGGRIKTRNGAAAIVYTPSDAKQQVDRLFQAYTNKDLQVSMDMSYEAVSAALQRTVVPLTYWFLWGWDAVFFRVALVQDCHDPRKFALVTSLAHAVGDGKTYYLLHNMLAHTNAPVVALNIQRKHYLHDAMVKTMGGPAFFGCYCYPSLGFVVRVARDILTKLCCLAPKQVVKLFWINQEWVNQQKKSCLLENTDQDFKPEFLSSNDVMASQFLRTTKCDQGLMTVNFRGKIKDCEELDAGNYYNFNPLRYDDFSTPVQIRKVVNQLKLGQRHPTTKPLTSLQQLFSTSPLAFFTNWADFAQPVLLRGCHQLLHMPLVPLYQFTSPTSYLQLFATYCYVYKPTKECDKLGVMISVSPKVMKELEATGMLGPELLKQ